MTAKQYLRKYQQYKEDIVFYESLKEDAINDVAGLKSPNLGERVQTSPKKDPIGDLVIELEKDIAKYDMAIISCRANMIIIRNQIDKVQEENEMYHKLLVYRYIIGLPWEDIAKKMLMAVSSVKHFHSPAIATFYNLFSEEIEK